MMRTIAYMAAMLLAVSTALPSLAEVTIESITPQPGASMAPDDNIVTITFSGEAQFYYGFVASAADSSVRSWVDATNIATNAWTVMADPDFIEGNQGELVLQMLFVDRDEMPILPTVGQIVDNPAIGVGWNADTERTDMITLRYDATGGVAGVTADMPEPDVYNLHGIKVGHEGSAGLPRGYYIVNGVVVQYIN